MSELKKSILKFKTLETQRDNQLIFYKNFLKTKDEDKKTIFDIVVFYVSMILLCKRYPHVKVFLMAIFPMDLASNFYYFYFKYVYRNINPLKKLTSGLLWPISLPYLSYLAVYDIVRKRCTRPIIMENSKYYKDQFIQDRNVNKQILRNVYSDTLSQKLDLITIWRKCKESKYTCNKCHKNQLYKYLQQISPNVYECTDCSELEFFDSI